MDLDDSKAQPTKKIKFCNVGFDLDKKVAATLMAKYKVEAGLCCSFAMDFAKKRLSNKPMDSETYKLEKRIRKIAKRQAIQGKKRGHFEGIKAVANAYGLKIDGARKYWGGTSQGIFETDGNDKATGVFYVTLEIGSASHGFAVDNRTTTVWLADEGSGIYTSDGGSLGDIVSKHLDLLSRKGTVLSFECLEVLLKS